MEGNLSNTSDTDRYTKLCIDVVALNLQRHCVQRYPAATNFLSQCTVTVIRTTVYCFQFSGGVGNK